MQLKLRVHSLFGDHDQLDDESLGEHLVAMVRRAIEAGKAPPVIDLVRPERLDMVPVTPELRSSIDLDRFVASLTRCTTDPPAGDPLAVGVMGVLHARPDEGGDRVPVATVFLEWPDCRWWHWRALLDPSSGALLDATQTVRRATDGDPLPYGLGRWWSAGRRHATRAHLAGWPTLPAPPGADEWVH